MEQLNKEELETLAKVAADGIIMNQRLLNMLDPESTTYEITRQEINEFMDVLIKLVGVIDGM